MFRHETLLKNSFPGFTTVMIHVQITMYEYGRRHFYELLHLDQRHYSILFFGDCYSQPAKFIYNVLLTLRISRHDFWVADMWLRSLFGKHVILELTNWLKMQPVVGSLLLS